MFIARSEYGKLHQAPSPPKVVCSRSNTLLKLSN
ncbi:unnamed protein product [Penicillium roqueforti FM164]|uniref:Genomic scaffold, ProqFM164S02 n=1 Tax=Penicillium roqueforti (strain FM164) TaxID=1365484 RepID=W6Q5T2_PENRF|nr:unnamed protein product [Penicillium roqueforti FM164]